MEINQKDVFQKVENTDRRDPESTYTTLELGTRI